MILCPVTRAMLFLIDLNLLSLLSSFVGTVEQQRSPFDFADLENLIGGGMVMVETLKSCGESDIAD